MDKQYRVVVPGIDGGGSQVFEAETPEELATQFQQAQENATAKIRELAQQNETYQQQIESLTPQPQGGAASPDGFNRQKYFNLLYENPIEAQKYAMQFVIGAPVEAFLSDYQNVRAGSIAGMQNMVNAQFAQKHPELLQVPQADDIHNSEQISKILTENGWTYNLNNLEAAYAVAKTQGKLKLNAAPSGPEAMMLSAPSVVSRPSGATDSTATEEEFLRTAPLDKVKLYLEKKYPNGARV
jgi:hypothetical protein